jgi:hypothetical protein
LKNAISFVVVGDKLEINEIEMEKREMNDVWGEMRKWVEASVNDLPHTTFQAINRTLLLSSSLMRVKIIHCSCED